MPEIMAKLNQRKIRWIIKELKRGKLSSYQISKQQGISKMHMWRVFHRFEHDKKPKLLQPGRKPQPHEPSEVAMVKKIKQETGFGAVNIEYFLKQQDILIPHNRIHRILLENGLAQEQPKNKNRRKCVRYERHHSNSLWHVDWFEYEGKQFILYEDDASRLITGFGEFPNANTENSVKVFDWAINKWAVPTQLMSDHGTQFCANEEKEYQFTEHLKSKGTEHILARVKHPKSNGKLERLVFTIKSLMKWKGNFEECVKWYNESRPHMSLNNDCLKTPLQAYYEKLPR